MAIMAQHPRDSVSLGVCSVHTELCPWGLHSAMRKPNAQLPVECCGIDRLREIPTLKFASLALCCSPMLAPLAQRPPREDRSMAVSALVVSALWSQPLWSQPCGLSPCGLSLAVSALVVSALVVSARVVSASAMLAEARA